MELSEATTARILLVEDDPHVRDAIARVLKFEGYEISEVIDGAEALSSVDGFRPDLILMDVMMPRVDGLEVCRLLRRRGDRTPILLLTARHEVSDRVAGLDAGADDYLPKPFALEELLARVRALLRRNYSLETAAILKLDDLIIDTASYIASRADKQLELTKTEFDLLVLLVTNSGIVVSRETIYDRIWGYDFETHSKSLDVYIGYLRRKTEEGNKTRLIHTVRGVGYVARL